MEMESPCPSKQSLLTEREGHKILGFAKVLSFSFHLRIVMTHSDKCVPTSKC